jgi:hypothetical protein
MYKDLIIYVSQYLSNKEKIYLSMTSLSFNLLKYDFLYDESVDMHTVFHLSYYNNFMSIRATCLDKLFPTNMIHLYLVIGRDFCDPITNPVPNSVIHLTLVLLDSSKNSEIPNSTIGNYITNSVTHFILHINTTYMKRSLSNTPIEFTCLRKNNPELFKPYPDSVISITTYMCC